MVFIDRFTPLDYQNKSEYNQHVLTERYNAAKSLRESYSNMYQMTLLRDSLQDYRAKQDNQPELQMSEEDRIRYNNMISFFNDKGKIESIKYFERVFNNLSKNLMIMFVKKMMKKF